MKTHKIHANFKKREDMLTFLNAYKIDIAFAVFLTMLSLQYYYYISSIDVPVWDGAVYLTNARNWLTDAPLFQVYRPQLISWLIAGIWMLTGENWIIVKGLQAVFTIGAGILLYITLKTHKGSLFALAVTALTMVNVQVFVYSSRILTEGFALFFLVATLYFLKSKKSNHWFIAGIMIGLTFASRYPIFLQALVILVVESLIRKDWKLSVRAIIGALPVIIIVISVIFLKAGTFQTALPKDTNFSVLLSAFYLMNSIEIWGLAFLLLPIAFIFKRTYTDKYNYTFIAWFIVALLFWSANTINNQYRFVIQFTPAVYYLIILAIENIARSNISFGSMISVLRKVISNSTSVKETSYSENKQ